MKEIKVKVFDWEERFPNFTMEELRCQHTQLDGIKLAFMDDIQSLRTWYGKPMVVTSAYRHVTHPIEAAKEVPGEHSDGLAIDLAIPRTDYLKVTAKWYEMGYGRVGWARNFIHLGGSKTRPQTVWTYS